LDINKKFYKLVRVDLQIKTPKTQIANLNMIVKEFFAFANIKGTVIEYLKNRADFESLPDKNKKPFRAHINKHQGLLAQQQANLQAQNQSTYGSFSGHNGHLD
jgi:hypothetical protein